MSAERDGRTRLAGAGAGARVSLRDCLPPAAGFAAALAVRLWRLDESCLWFDELFGLHAARHAWGDLPRFVALDLVHPPLFYLLLKVWTAAGGESVWWLRLLPAALSSLALVPLWLLARELRLTRHAAALALALAATSGCLVKYAQEVRMYAPLLLLASCSLWLFARFCRARDADADETGGRDGDDDAERRDGSGAEKRDDSDAARARRDRRARLVALVALTAANLLLVYTHYFGWLLVALELAFVVAWARDRVKPFAASLLVVAACFAPWAWAVWSAAGAAGGGLQQNIGWAARPRALELPLPYLLLHEPFRFQRHSAEAAVLSLTVVMSLLLFAPALAALAVRELKRKLGGREPERAPGGHEIASPPGRRDARGDGQSRASFAPRFLVFFSVAPVVSAFALSWVLPQSVWGTRHLAVVAPAYLLLVAHAVTSLRPRWLASGVQLLLGCWLLLALAGWAARRPAPLVWCSWETLSAQLARAEDGRGRVVTVYAAEELAAYHLWHALGAKGGGTKFRVVVLKNVPGLVEDRAFFLPRGFDEVTSSDADAALGGDDFWVVFRAPAADNDHPLLRALAARGYETGPRFEATAQGQRVTLVRAVRR